MYGLVIKYDKLILISIRYARHMRKPDKTHISWKSSMIDVGCMLAHDNKVERAIKHENKKISYIAFENFIYCKKNHANINLETVSLSERDES